MLLCQIYLSRLVTTFCRQFSVFHMFENSTTRSAITELVESSWQTTCIFWKVDINILKYTKSNYPLFRSEIIYLWRYSCANTDNYAKLSCFKVEWSLKLSTYTHFRVVFIHVYAKWQVDQNILQSQLGERIATVQFQFLEKMLNQMDVSFIFFKIASCLKDFFITIFRIWISCFKYIF